MWRQPFWIITVCVIPYLALAAIALYWPADSALFGVNFGDSWLARMVPSVAGYISKSQFPSATAAYFVFEKRRV